MEAGDDRSTARVTVGGRLPCGTTVLCVSGLLTGARCAEMVSEALQGPHGRRVALLLDLRRCVVCYDPNDGIDPGLEVGVSRLVPIAFLIGPEQAWFGERVRRLARRVGVLRRCFATAQEALAWLAEEADLSAATAEHMLGSAQRAARDDARFQALLARLVSTDTTGDRPSARP